MGEPVKKRFCTASGSLGSNWEYSGNIRRARLLLENDSAWHGGRLGLWLGAVGYRLGLRLGLTGSNMARMWLSCRLRLAHVGCASAICAESQEARVDHRGLRSGCSLHQWVRMEELYTVEWSKRVFDNFENSGISQNTSVFWRTGLWYQLLVGETTGGGFETLRRDKTQSFITRTQAYKDTKAYNTHPLSLFSVSLYSLHTI